MSETVSKRTAMSFSQFGEAFINLILQGDVLERAISAKVPPTYNFHGGNDVAGYAADVKITLGDIKELEGRPNDHKSFNVPLNIHLVASTALAKLEVGKVLADVSVELVLNGYCIKPLGIKLDIQKLSTDAIKVVSQFKGIWGLLQLPANLADDKIFDELRKWLNKEVLPDLNRTLFFDLEDQVKTAIDAAVSGSGAGGGAAGGGAAGKPDLQNGVPVALGGPEIVSTLNPGSGLFAKLPGGLDGVLRVIILTKPAAASDPPPTQRFVVLDEDDAKRSESEIECGDAEDWQRTDFVYYSETASAKELRFRVINPGPGKVQVKFRVEEVE